jgi:hypothetical protein
MTVYGPASLAAGQSGVRTKMVRCHGAQKVAWVLRASGTDILVAAKPFGTLDQTANAPTGNFLELGPGVLGAQLGNPDPLADMSKGGTLCEIGPDVGAALCLEQAELRIDSHLTNAIAGFTVTCEIHDEIGEDVNNSSAVTN